MNRNSIARVTPAAPAAASSAASCHADGLNLMGRLGTGAHPRRCGSAQDAHFEAVRLPDAAVNGVARIKDALSTDQARDQVEVQRLERAMFDQQHDRLGIQQSLLDGQHWRRQPLTLCLRLDVRIAQTHRVTAFDGELRHTQRRRSAPEPPM